MKTFIILSFFLAAAASQAAPASGPLRVSLANPRHFSDASGKAVYLTGSHTWNTLQDIAPGDPPAEFDFAAHLDFLERHHHNFIRLWRWELLTWQTAASPGKPSRLLNAAPHPWARTGPGEALDGKPKFDLTQFDDAYFQRLRSRVSEAGRRGIYVSIMLFEGWGLRFAGDGWKAHPFHPANNIQGIDADKNKDGKGLEIYTGDNREITRLQMAYIRKVVDTVNGFDNVLYEISNENPLFSTEWQYELIRYVKGYEATKPKRHPVGMTSDGFGGEEDTDRLFKSPADWISPSPDRDDYKTNPPPAIEGKVIIVDTDHLWGIGGDVPWVWKSFLRGLNPIFMDPYQRGLFDRGEEAAWEAVRRAMGDTRRFAGRMDLAWMKPRPELASTAFCLARPGLEYLIYQPKAGEGFTVKLEPNKYDFEWFDPAKGAAVTNSVKLVTGKEERFKAPFEGDAVLYLRAKKQ